MTKKIIRRYMPDPEKIKNSPSLQFLGSYLLNPDLWHLNRRSAALAFFVGVFVAFIPMPFQMVVAAIIALLVRCNLPISVALVWITNPVTMPILWFFTYKFGCFLLQSPVLPHDFEMSLEWLTQEIGRIWLPLYAGSIIAGMFFASLAYISVRLLWRWHIVRNWKKRQR